MQRRRTFFIAVSGMLIGSVGLGQLTFAGAGPAAAPSQPVLVTNTASQPVPVAVHNLPGTQAVSGTVSVSNFPATVNVGNLPTTQAVSGTVNVGNLPTTQSVAGTVNVGNLPAVQAVASGDSTVTIASEVVDLDGATSKILLSNVDVSPYKTVRLFVLCTGTSACMSAPANIHVVDATCAFSCRLDDFAMPSVSPFSATRVYEVPSPRMSVSTTSAHGDMDFEYKLVGRRN